MSSRFNFALSVATGSLVAFSFGCSNDGTSGTGAGGAIATGGQPGGGGTVGSGGKETGGTVATGGNTGAGGDSVTGGQNGTGGATSSGGVTIGSGGTTSSGGVTIGGGGTTVTGKGGTTSSGGVTLASGGTTGPGGASGTGAASAGGSTGPIGTVKKFVGNIDTSGSIRTDFSKYWDQFTPENAGKWGSVQGSSQSSFSWTSLDAMYKYCNDNNIIFKQHNFIWGSQQPGWTSSLTTSTGPAAIQNWMTSFCTRYPKVAIIDVVNEPPPHTTPAYANAIGGGTNSTWDWIANAFKWARAACPNALLVLNDYNNDEQSGDAQHSIDLVTAIKKLGAPIDGVGCQTHGAASLSSSTLKTNIDKIASGTGLGVYITEYDINTSNDTTQENQYKDHFTMFMSNTNIKGATIWGYVVGRTWETNSGIMNSDGTLRPAMTWLMSFLGR